MSVRPVSSTRSPQRSLFWPGFVLGLLLLIAFSCGGLSSMLGLSDISLADIQGAGPRWTPPPVTPTPEGGEVTDSAAAADTTSEVAGAFGMGQRARNSTNSRVNIRRTSGHLGKPDGDIIGQMQPGETIEIIGGPELTNNLTWWFVRYSAASGSTIDGWVAEATSSGVQILGSAE